MAIQTKEVKVKVYSLIRPVDKEKDKCPPQAGVIVEAVAEAKGKIDRAALIAVLKDGRVKTNQTVERIFAFYRQKLIDMGVLREEVRVDKVDVVVPDKPAKEPKVEKPKVEKPAKEPKAEKPAAGPAAPQKGTAQKVA